MITHTHYLLSLIHILQQRLSQWGYYKGPVDGVYGYETFRAVQNFQRNNGLPIDGVTGKATRDALGLSMPDADVYKRQIQL